MPSTTHAAAHAHDETASHEHRASTLVCLIRDAAGLAGLTVWAWASLRLLGAL